MKIMNKTFVFPVLIHETHTFYGSTPDIAIRWRKSKMGGSMKSTSYTIDLWFRGKRKQWTFVWRPDVTRYWWNKK